MSRFEICLSGHGGQGMVLSGKILGEALALFLGKNVVQTQSYGPEARGGKSRSEIILSEEPIDYPKIIKLDLLLAMSQESLNSYLPNLRDGGILVVDNFGVKNIPIGKYKTYRLDIALTSKNELGKIIFGNIIALGAIAAITKIIPLEQLEKAVLSNVPKATGDSNKKALEIGFKIGREALERQS